MLIGTLSLFTELWTEKLANENLTLQRVSRVLLNRKLSNV